MIAKTNWAGFLGTGSFAPDQVWTNKDLEKFLDTSDEWIRTRTGIGARHVAPKGMNTSDMATEAAKRALEMAKVKPEELDMIIVCTLTPDTTIPSTACIVQDNIGAVRAAAFDLYAGCSGFVYGSVTAAQFIENGIYDKILVIGAEVLTRVINWKDRNTCVLFGDGAGAAVLGKIQEGYGIYGVDMGADGSGGKYLTIPASGVAMIPTDKLREEGWTYAHMDGREVYKFAVKAMPGTAERALERSGMTSDQVDLLIPHQANIRIIQSAAKRLHIPMEKVFVNIEKYANTSGASIPIAMDEANRGGRIHHDDVVLLAGFGAGLTWAGLVAKWF
jgi:3-oxoacyl-[acyl-carrier-protein] synthase-3